MHTNTRYLLWYSSLNPSLWVRCAHTALQALVLPLGSTGGLALHSQALLLLAFAQVISSFRNVLCSPDEFSLLEALPNCPKQRVLLHLLWFCVFLSPQITWDHFQLPWPLLWPQFQHTKDGGSGWYPGKDFPQNTLNQCYLLWTELSLPKMHILWS